MAISREVESFVRTQRAGRLATVDARGRPHIVPICFVYSDGCLYSVLDAKPKRVPVERLQRVRNLLARPDVQVLVDRYDEDWTRLAYVQLRGRARLLLPGPEQVAAAHLLREKYAQYVSMDLRDRPVIRIDVLAAVAWGDLTAGTSARSPGAKEDRV
jgi:PPOX class probable F420-dependent enzyme